MRLGTPHLHLRATTSTNDRARELAARGAPHGTLVTADEQSAGRGRQGRRWVAPPGRSLLLSLVLREPHPLLPLVAAVAVADVCGRAALVKWPNDVLLGGRKVAGILAEGRPQEGWAVLGIGLNVAAQEFPPELTATATTLGLDPSALPAVRAELLRALERELAREPPELLERWRERDALLGRAVRWSGGEGTGAGIDSSGALRVTRADGGVVALDAGEVHLSGALSSGG